MACCRADTANRCVEGDVSFSYRSRGVCDLDQLGGERRRPNSASGHVTELHHLQSSAGVSKKDLKS